MCKLNEKVHGACKCLFADTLLSDAYHQKSNRRDNIKIDFQRILVVSI